MDFGLPELIIILIIVLVLFGSTRLPKLSRSIGQSIKELREGFGSKTPSKGPSKGPSSEDMKAEDKKDENKV